MKVEIRSDHCHISGYVNAVERWSRPIREKGADGRIFSERIAAGAFRDALARNKRVKLMHNHQRTIDDERSGRFQLTEDAIGLHFEGDVFDPEILERARAKELVGWSFGFYNREKEDEPSDDGKVAFRRTVKSMELDEVSIIDKRMLPACSATSLEVRGGVDCPDEIQLRAEENEIEYVDDGGEDPTESGNDPAEYKRAILRKRLEIAEKG